ncbi:MAG: phosphotransferase [Desulfamplus sp.]|nr:phosphotransferase [Desulfamplus sp.]
MKALILAAGFGTRLLPHTAITPKPLFTLNSVPMLQRCISQLTKAGCTSIIINSHHLHNQIEEFIKRCNSQNLFDIEVTTIYEPEILNTGGAIRNVKSFMGDHNFIVINSDVASDIDLKALFDFHLSAQKTNTKSWCATLLLHDYAIFNKVIVDKNGFIRGFLNGKLKSYNYPDNNKNKLLAFTGIQVLSPEIFDHIDSSSQNFKSAPFSTIELYSELADQGDLVKAFICNDIFWQDIGTPQTYKDAAIRFITSDHLGLNQDKNLNKVKIRQLAGDGSDRGWFRCTDSDTFRNSVIVADHGIAHQSDKSNLKVEEIDSFIKIGEHLFKQGICVPKIKGYDRFAGLVVVEDLGDTHLQDVINLGKSHIEYYKKIVSLAIDFSIKGIIGFDDSWTFQTSTYSKEMILEKECGYFVEAFLQNYLKLDVQFDDFIDEFSSIADGALDGALQGLMHRDMQSRNIMVKDGKYFFIDFQSARRGPLQYDLASLLIDPYVNLEDEVRELILYESVDKVGQLFEDDLIKKQLKDDPYLSKYEHDPKKFIKCYRYCATTRNMQMLGAFSHLSMNMGKTFFEQYIPIAVKNLKKNLKFLDADKIAAILQF